MQKLLIAAVGLFAGFASLSAHADQLSNLEDVALGGDGTYTAPTFTSGGVQYGGLTAPFSDGFVVSNHTDVTDYGDDAFMHQYDAIAGQGGAAGSLKYAVATDFSSVYLNLSSDPLSLDLTNTTYAYYSMFHGDQFAKQFGGPSGNDPDYLLLTISGYTASNSLVGTVPFYLADFRFSNNAQDYVLDNWATADLSSLVGARKLNFSLTSTDVGMFGMNTPAYFAADNLRFKSPVLGDLNDSGLRNNLDIHPFEVALADANQYLALFPAVTDFEARGDINADGDFNNLDIHPFEVLLASGSGPVAVPEPNSLVLAATALAMLLIGRAGRRHGLAWLAVK